MFVVVGSLNLFASMAGFWGSYHKKRILLVFIVVGGFSVLLQIAFDISLFTSESGILVMITTGNSADGSLPFPLLLVFNKVTTTIAPLGPPASQQATHDKVCACFSEPCKMWLSGRLHLKRSILCMFTKP